MDSASALRRAKSSESPGESPLPFGGLGLDLAETRRKVSGLRLKAFPRQEAPRVQSGHEAPPPLSGYGLLLRLSRETLGS